ncbi:MAG: ExeM/NucH family extracellular endonuclease [Roseiflexus sp.]|nr:ExeM/NucH family extracellular endonuclease [Roseiflexus sp.]
MIPSRPRPSAALRLLLALTTLALLVAGAFVAPQRAAATSTIITQWTFNSPVPDNNTTTGTTDPAIGSGTASLVGGTTATFASGDVNNRSSDPATGDDSAWNTTNYAPQGTEDRQRGAQFAVSTVGYQNIRFSFDLRHSNTAANTVALLYSTDGGATFTEATTFVANAGDTWFNDRSFDFSGIPALNNNPNVVFRVVAAFASGSNVYVASNPGSSYGTAGTLRFDMVTVRGDPISSATPTPSPTPESTPTATPTPSPTLEPTPTTTPTPSPTPVPVACSAPDTPINQVQGSGETSPLSGTVVTIQGVVVGDYEGPSPNLRGFYLQEIAQPDADPLTSEGIFVFNRDANSVSLGQVVQVTGRATEFQGQTQVSATAIEVCSTTATVTPVDVFMPFPSADYLERYEGMLVRFPQTLYVTEHFQLGRFGQIVMSSGARLRQPTDVVDPGPAALALQAANDLNRIIVDDELNNQNPDPIRFGRGGNPLSASNTLRGGDTATGIVGVLTFTWSGNVASGNAYRLRPVNALGGGVPNFVAANPRPDLPRNVGGDLRVASFNVLNYFNTFGAGACRGGVGGAPTDCRGAEDATEFERQNAKLLAALLRLDADVFGLMEIENDGYGPTSALAELVNRLNAATAPGTYAFIDADAATGQTNALGMDAIKVALIYKPAVVEPVGRTAALNTVAFVNGGDGAPRNRPALAQTFRHRATGEDVTVVVNHFKSKGSPCDIPDQGDGSGNCNIVRRNAAQELVAWLATNPTGTGDQDILIIGDLNSYAQEDPIDVLRNAGYTDVVRQFVGAEAYSYVFNGQWGTLDYALASPSALAKVSGATVYHINADEPNALDYNLNFKSPGQITSLFAPDQYRSSDHDPILVGLNLNDPAALSAVATFGAERGITGAEIIDIRGNRAVLSNADAGTVYVLDTTDLLDIRVLATVTGLTGLNSVAIHPTQDYFLAVAGSAKPAAAPVNGTVYAYRLDGTLIASASTGIQPDSVAISPNGQYAVIANEAEGFAVGDNGGPGSLTVVNLSGFDPNTSTTLSVTQIPLPSLAGTSGFTVNRTDDIARLPIDNTPATLEPESVTFSADSQFAYITLQENNGVARLSLADNSLTFFGLGKTTHVFDTVNGDGFNPTRLLSLFREPDGIAYIEIGGVGYVVTADEGDTRDDIPSGAISGRVRGGRTVSVFNAATGALVGDTGNQLDALAARYGIYPDGRSDRGGSEPEVLDAKVFGGRAIVAVGLERANAIALVDITNPSTPNVFQIIPGGMAPEGIKLVERNGALYALAANEVSNTLTVARVPLGDALFTQTYTEETPLALHDPFVIDPDSAPVQVTLAVAPATAGTLNTTTFSGAPAAVNAALANLTFTPAPNYAGPVTITVSASDGQTATSGRILLAGIPVPPVTAASVSGPTTPRCPADCFFGSATVTLTTNQPATTRYRVNGGAWQTYTAPFTITTEGTNLVEFFSTDEWGAVEGVRSITVKVTTFPATGVLDNFNRRNGRLGANWTGATQLDQYRIVSNQVDVEKGGAVLWTKQFGNNQEAFVTLTGIDPNSPHHTLLLKGRGANATQGAILVSYDAVNRQITVEALRPGWGWYHVQTFGNITLKAGDVLGARALANGSVRVYVNCELIGVADTTTVVGNLYVNRGGRIGLFYHLANNATLDDFGGGNR